MCNNQESHNVFCQRLLKKNSQYLFFDFPGHMQPKKCPPLLLSLSLIFLILFKLISFTVFGRTCSFRKESSSLHLLTSSLRPLLRFTWSVARTGSGVLINCRHVSRTFRLSCNPLFSTWFATCKKTENTLTHQHVRHGWSGFELRWCPSPRPKWVQTICQGNWIECRGKELQSYLLAKQFWNKISNIV